MHSESKRKELIKCLKNDKSLRLEVPEEVIEKANPEDVEDYRLLAEHLLYLRRKRKTVPEKERKKIEDEMNEVVKYMLIAEFGDRNIERFGV